MYKFAFAAGISVFALAMISNRDLASIQPAPAAAEAVVVRATFAALADEAAAQHAPMQSLPTQAVDATAIDRDGSWRQWPNLTDF